MENKNEVNQKNEQKYLRNEIVNINAEDVIELILRDHIPLKKLIETLKDDQIGRSQKEAPLEQFIPLLVSHAKAEEKSLYVQMKKIKSLRVGSFEGDTEHEIAENLIHEINASADDDKWNAKVKVLAELIEHHIEEEENEMLKKVQSHMDLPTRKAAGAVYTELKSEFDMLYRARYINARFTTGRRNIDLLN